MRIVSDRKWAIAAAFVLALGGAGTAAAQHGGATGGMDHGASGSTEHSQHHGGASDDTSSKGHGGAGGGGCMMMGGGMDHGAKGEGGGMMMKHLCRPGEHVEGRLAYLKAELKLTDAQTPAWNAFADAFRTSAQKVAQYCASMKDHEHAGGMLQQLGAMERNMTAHLEFVRAVKGAAEPLFGVLTDEQKKLAEETMTGQMGLGMGGMKGGKGGMGGMMGKH